MKIVYVCADFGIPLYGSKGASIHIRELVRALRSLGHEVLVLTPRAGGKRPPEFDSVVVEIPTAESDEAICGSVERECTRSAAKELRAALYRGTFLARALPVARTFDPDVVYERYSLFGSAGRDLAAELEVPLLMEVNAPLADEQELHRGLVFAEAARRVESDVLRSADRVVAVSRELASWLAAVGVEPSRIAVVPNAVDTSRFEAALGDRSRVRAALGARDEALVGFLGSLRPWHDLPGLIDALASLSNGSRPFTLVVIGDGPMAAAVRDRARAANIKAVFTGAVPHEQVPSYLSALDVAVAPYAPMEPFYFSPLKVVEYLAAAVPVVAADIGDLRHCVRPGETGWLYRPGDSTSLAAAIGAVLGDERRARELALAGRDHARDDHSWRANAQRIARLAEGAPNGGLP